MSIELPNDAENLPSTESSSMPRFALSDHFDKLEREFGFIAPSEVEELLGSRITASDKSFEDIMRTYVAECMVVHPDQSHPRSEVYQFRGILAHLSQIYYERYTDKEIRGMRDIHLKYVCKEYLATIDEDIRYLGEPPIEELDHLLLALDIDLPNFPKRRILRDVFRTNVIHVLSKIDPNILPLWKSIE